MWSLDVSLGSFRVIFTVDNTNYTARDAVISARIDVYVERMKRFMFCTLMTIGRFY